MKLSIAIVGLPNVGKSTLFTVLTKQQVLIANYPFATIDPNVGVVPVPDQRLDKLAELSHSKKKIPAVVEFFDIAGLVKGANQGEGLGNQFLANIRDCQAVVVVLRIFQDSNTTHVEGSVDPLRDLDIITTELILKDLDSVDKRLDKLEKESKIPGAGQAAAQKNLGILKEIRGKLSKNQLVSEYRDTDIMKEMQLLSAKRQLYLLNGDPEEASPELLKALTALGGEFVICNVALADDVNELIRKAYHALDLISFFTTGEDETRAWTTRHGAKAPEAAGEIHTDFEHRFIRAEVIHWKELVELAEEGGQSAEHNSNLWGKAREHGKLRVEGKEYVVQDGDVLEIRHG